MKSLLVLGATVGALAYAGSPLATTPTNLPGSGSGFGDEFFGGVNDHYTGAVHFD